ncbi:MAG: hypothetical protein ACQCN6_05080 [Candidatus Bathyarchaeia archaeon]|jgi:hypothetical protein
MAGAQDTLRLLWRALVEKAALDDKQLEALKEKIDRALKEKKK